MKDMQWLKDVIADIGAWLAKINPPWLPQQTPGQEAAMTNDVFRAYDDRIQSHIVEEFSRRLAEQLEREIISGDGSAPPSGTENVAIVYEALTTAQPAPHRDSVPPGDHPLTESQREIIRAYRVGNRDMQHHRDSRDALYNAWRQAYAPESQTELDEPETPDEDHSGELEGHTRRIRLDD